MEMEPLCGVIDEVAWQMPALELQHVDEENGAGAKEPSHLFKFVPVVEIAKKKKDISKLTDRHIWSLTFKREKNVKFISILTNFEINICKIIREISEVNVKLPSLTNNNSFKVRKNSVKQNKVK